MLQTAERHQPGKEEGHHHPFPDVQRILMPVVGLRIADEEQQEAHEHRRMVGKSDDTDEEGEVHGGDDERDFAPFVGLGLDLPFPGDFPAEEPGQNARIEQDGHGEFPAKIHHHEGRIPLPLGSDHEYRRSSKVRHRSPDGDVDKQHADRRVFQAVAELMVEIGIAQQNRRQRHRRRFGDERAEQRHHRQAQKIEGQRRG